MKKPQKPKSKSKPKGGRGNAAPAPHRHAETIAVSRFSWAETRNDRPAKSYARRPSAATAAYTSDDRETIATLILPFLLMALAMTISQSLRRSPDLGDLIATSPAPIWQPVRTVERSPVEVLPPVPSVARPAEIRAPAVVVAPPLAAPPAAAAAPAVALSPVASVEVAHAAPAESIVTAPPALSSPPIAPVMALPAETPAQPAVAATPQIALVVPGSDLPVAKPVAEALPVARLAPADANGPVMAALGDPVTPEAPINGPITSTPDVTSGLLDNGTQCLADGPSPMKRKLAAAVSFVPEPDAQAFGVKLAQAARTQLTEFVIYDDTYRSMSYPMGDVPPLFGVCTDVIIRAYRALGLDLQALVHTSRIGSGDTNIDHRRVDTLRRYFTAFGEKIPITEFAEDYRPGDVVSYYRPQNRHSRSHIAVVSDVIGPSGRPMIIHNRGWGPQMEDALFVDEITGHYRYSGPKQPSSVAQQAQGSGVPAAGAKSLPRGSGPVLKASLAQAKQRGAPAPAPGRSRTN